MSMKIPLEFSSSLAVRYFKNFYYYILWIRYSGTYTGHYEPVKEISDLLDEYESRTGNFVPIHGRFWFIALVYRTQSLT